MNDENELKNASSKKFFIKERERSFFRGCRLFNILDDVRWLNKKNLKRLIKMEPFREVFLSEDYEVLDSRFRLHKHKYFLNTMENPTD